MMGAEEVRICPASVPVSITSRVLSRPLGRVRSLNSGSSSGGPLLAASRRPSSKVTIVQYEAVLGFSSRKRRTASSSAVRSSAVGSSSRVSASRAAIERSNRSCSRARTTSMSLRPSWSSSS